MVVYGWHSAHGQPLFVYDSRRHWGVTRCFAEATRFRSVQQCIDHWLGKHRFPEDYVSLIGEGHLQFYNARSRQQIILLSPPPTLKAPTFPT